MKGQNYTPQTKRLRLALSVFVEKDGNSFHAFCPGLKGLHVDGHSEEEAIQNAAEAATCYIGSLIRHGDPLPIGPHFTAEHEEHISPIPPGALLRHIEVQCAIQETFGGS